MDIQSFFIPIAHAAEEAAANQGVAATLGINWMLFIAQLVNFAIILGVLWKWVFIPVSKKLEERTSKIEKSLTDADRIEKEKLEFTKWREQEMTKARQEAGSIIATAQTDANKVKAEISQKTKEEQEKIIAQAKVQMQSEMNKSLNEAKGEIANMVTTAAEKILRKKLDTKQDQELIKESLASIK